MTGRGANNRHMPNFPMLRAPGMANRGFGLLGNRPRRNPGGFAPPPPVGAQDDGPDPQEAGNPEAPETLAPRAGSMGTGVPAAPPPAPNLSAPRMANARASNKAAVFAAGAPIPKNSAYGDPQTAAAARNAFVADQSANADALSGNFYQNHQVTADANARQNRMAAPRADYLSSLGNKNNAEAEYRKAEGDVLVPSQARRNDAASGLETAQAGQVTATTPGTVDNLNANAEDRRAGAKLKGAQAENVASGGEAAKGQLATYQKQIQAQQARIHQLETLLGHRKDDSGDPVPIAAPSSLPPITNAPGAGATRPSAVMNGAGSRPLPLPPGSAPAPAAAAPVASANPFSKGRVFTDDTGKRIRWNGSDWEPVPQGE